MMAVLVLVMSITMLAVPASAASATPTVEIPVSIELTGTLPTPAEKFTIEMKADDASFPLPSGASGVYTTEITGAGSTKLQITYTRVGIYTYTIRQLPGTNEDCYQDATEYTVTVYVTNAEGGGLDTTVAIYEKDKDDAIKQHEIVFKNRYANPVNVRLSAVKLLDGRTPWTSGLFEFSLTDSKGSEIARVKNDGRDVTFPEMTFDKVGTYTYTIKEITRVDNTVTFDKSVYTVVITVTKENGDYAAKVTYLKNGKAYEGTPVFYNFSNTNDNPRTADESHVVFYAGLMAVSAAAMYVLLVNKKRYC